MKRRPVKGGVGVRSGARGSRTPKGRSPAAFKAAAIPLGKRSVAGNRISKSGDKVKGKRRGLTRGGAGRIITHVKATDDKDAAGREPWREAVAAFACETREALGDKLVRVVLFGSRARGDYEADSDLDLIVFVRGNADVSAAQAAVRRIAWGIAEAHDYAFLVMAFVYTEESFRRDATYFFIKNVKAEGVEVRRYFRRWRISLTKPGRRSQQRGGTPQTALFVPRCTKRITLCFTPRPRPWGRASLATSVTPPSSRTSTVSSSANSLGSTRALHADFTDAFEARLRFDYQPQKASADDAARAIAAAERFLAVVSPYVEDWLKTARDKEP